MISPNFIARVLFSFPSLPGGFYIWADIYIGPIIHKLFVSQSNAGSAIDLR